MKRLAELNVLASEMELSHICILASSYWEKNVNVGAIAAIISGDDENPFTDNKELINKTIARTISIAIDSLKYLWINFD